MKLNVIVLFGGVSSEHEVSCLSAASILRNADTEQYELFPVGITRQGEWRLCPNLPDKIESGEWAELEYDPAFLSPDRKTHGLVVLKDGKAETIRADVVFPVLHGACGEDGTMQGLLELSGIPYVGAGVAASANAMDKSITKILVDATSVRQARYYLARRGAFKKDAAAAALQAETAMGGIYPLFVKPCSSGSSVGVTRAENRQELQESLLEAFRYDAKALVEEFIDGQEIEVAVLGNLEPVASAVGEIAPKQAFYTYDAKYKDASSALYIPARIPNEATEAARRAAIEIYTALGCVGMARVDFFCKRGTNEIIFNEINTIPGFTSISMYPKLFIHGGVPYGRLIDRLIELALKRSADA